MEYGDNLLRIKIEEAVLRALAKNPSTTTLIVEELFVQLKPLVKKMSEEYNESRLISTTPTA